MLYGKILRPPSYGATLESIDLSPAKGMKDVVVVQDGEFVGFAAPTTFRAEQALGAASKTANWKTVAHPSSDDLFSYLKQHAGRSRPSTKGSVETSLAAASKVLSETYHVAYVQHAPMEPRAATAEWKDGNLTVWAGIDYPQRIQGDLARAFDMPSERVRVIVPDMGGGFGGKHSGEAAEEAARLAKAAGRPVAVHWTRAEEFTWAYFRPAAVIECQGGLDDRGRLVAWGFTNINAGGAAIDTPYEIPNTRHRVRKLRLAAEARRVSLPRRDGQQLRSRVLHGRTGGRRRRRPARLPTGPSGESADPHRVGARRPTLRLASAEEEGHAGVRRRAWLAERRRIPSWPPAWRWGLIASRERSGSRSL